MEQIIETLSLLKGKKNFQHTILDYAIVLQHAN